MTAKPLLEISLRPPERIDGGFLRRAALLRRHGGAQDGDTVLWYDIPEAVPALDEDDAEPFLIASLMDATSEGRDVLVHGRVGHALLSNLHEFMVAWAKWVPTTFRVVEIRVDALDLQPLPSPLPPDTAVAAFSGGVDATCTVWRHSQGLEGHRSRRVAACVLIHGFDIALEDQGKFAWSLRSGRETLDSLAIPLHPVRTNFREVMRAHWEHSHGAALVSALQFLKPLAPSCLLGSSKPYDDLVFPYGSNPISDALLGSATLQVLHDGARFDRTEKIAEIARWPMGKRNLRVCWRGRQTEANCGKCEKCIRTKLSFLALGEEAPPSLGAPPSAWQILNLVFLSRAIQVDFQQILGNCQRHKVRAPWVLPLWLRVRYHKVFVKLLHWKWKILHAFGKV